MPDVVAPERIRHHLNIVRAVALVDALLLVPLVIAAIAGEDAIVAVLGPIHGLGFIALLMLVTRGAGERLWGWWFPALVVVTLGPPGSLIGDLRIRRALPS